jgi:hypothetical protein
VLAGGVNLKKVQTMRGDAVDNMRVPVEPPALEDGYYWFRNWINLRGGCHVDRWKLARVVGGMVQRFGSDALIDQDCPYLRHSMWVRIESPHTDANAVCLLTDGRGQKRGSVLVTQDNNRAVSERVRMVAEGIVDAFLAMHDSTVGYYARNPHHKEELVAQIARLIASVRG